MPRVLDNDALPAAAGGGVATPSPGLCRQAAAYRQGAVQAAALEASWGAREGQERAPRGPPEALAGLTIGVDRRRHLFGRGVHVFNKGHLQGGGPSATRVARAQCRCALAPELGPPLLLPAAETLRQTISVTLSSARTQPGRTPCARWPLPGTQRAAPTRWRQKHLLGGGGVRISWQNAAEAAAAPGRINVSERKCREGVEGAATAAAAAVGGCSRSDSCS